MCQVPRTARHPGSGEMKMRYGRIFSALAFALLLGLTAQPASAQHRAGPPPPPPHYGPRVQYRARAAARANRNAYQAAHPGNGSHPPSTYQPAPNHTNGAPAQANGAVGNSRPAQTPAPGENAVHPNGAGSAS